MYTMEDLKTNRDAQITVGCVAFFLIAFPVYFSIAAADAAGTTLGGGVGDYQVNGEIEYVLVDSGTEYVADGTPWTGTFSSDSVDGAEDMNIVGIRLSLSYGEDETGRGPPCVSQTAADTISGMAMHGEHTGTADGQNNGGSGAHEVMAEWYNASMVGAVVSGLSTNEIEAQIDSMGAGLGQYDIEISVSAVGDSCTLIGGDNQDDGEEVSYTLELMVFDYTIAPYLEVDV